MKKVIAFTCWLTIGAGYAAAQQPPDQISPVLAQLRAICANDIQKLCANVQAGGGRILRCMSQHQNDISPPCKQAILQALQAQRAQAPPSVQNPTQPPSLGQGPPPAAPAPGLQQSDLGLSQ